MVDCLSGLISQSLTVFSDVRKHLELCLKSLLFHSLSWSQNLRVRKCCLLNCYYSGPSVQNQLEAGSRCDIWHISVCISVYFYGHISDAAAGCFCVVAAQTVKNLCIYSHVGFYLFPSFVNAEFACPLSSPLFSSCPTSYLTLPGLQVVTPRSPEAADKHPAAVVRVRVRVTSLPAANPEFYFFLISLRESSQRAQWS